MDKRAIAKAFLPRPLFEKVIAVWSRSYQKRLLHRMGLLEASRRYIERNGLTVKYGPFAGMVYGLDVARNRHVIPKLLGSYEQELHPIIQKIRSRRYDAVIDIGSAEGYYAVGLARMLQTPVLAYDPEPNERKWCMELARLNGVSSLVEPKRLFLPADLRIFAEKKLLVLCDAEGFEGTLFKEESLPLTKNWNLLIELHGSCLDSLPKLPWPHKTSIIRQATRSESYRELEGIGKSPTQLLSEYRSDPNQTWLWCENVPEDV